MKLRIYQFGFIALILILLAGCGPSEVVVRSRPVAPVYVRPVAPRPNYVWVEGNWIKRGHHYVYRRGYWVAPRASYHQYQSGHWEQRRNGWYWVSGRWN
ncbi:MAG: hypothetical protein ABI683_07305 [Ginsengibacter sp.]